MTEPTPEQWEWLFGFDVGASSKAIWRTMIGAEGRPDAYWPDTAAYPRDPSDFGRCWRLLARFPEWRERLGEMRKYGPVWSALVSEWDAIEAVYVEEMDGKRAPHTYALMQDVIRRAKYAPIPGVEDAIPATEPSEDDRDEYAREDAPLLQEDRR